MSNMYYTETQDFLWWSSGKLRPCLPLLGGVGSIPSQGTETPHAAGCSQRVKKRKGKKKYSLTLLTALQTQKHT